MSSRTAHNTYKHVPSKPSIDSVNDTVDLDVDLPLFDTRFAKSRSITRKVTFVDTANLQNLPPGDPIQD